MGGLGNILSAIGEHPMAKWIVALMALRALWTLLSWRRCQAKMDEDRLAETIEVMEARRQALFRHSSRFLIVMLLGIGLAIAGLFGLAKETASAPLSMLMLVAGIYLFMTEPIRQQISDDEDRVAITARRGADEAHAVALAMLKGNHIKLILFEFSVAAGLGLAILALSGRMPMPSNLF